MPKVLSITPRRRPFMLCVPFGAPKEHVAEWLQETMGNMHTPPNPRDIEVRYIRPMALRNAGELLD